MVRPETAFGADGPSILLRDDLAGTEMRFATPRDVIRADHPDEIQDALDRMEYTRADGKWCAGYINYEAGYALELKLRDIMPEGRRLPLVLMGVFDAPETGSVVTRTAGTATLTDVRPEWSFEDYRPRFEQVHQHLRTGNCYQANLTFPFSACWQGDPTALFEEMTARQPVRYAALVKLDGPIILSRSPEMFFEVDADGWIETHPMKGTIRRGQTPETDAALAETLRRDEKNRAKNLMIVDLLRNDISRICELGTLRVPELFRIESYPTVQQLVSRVRARLAPGTTVSEIFTALFPCGSITGAPKIRAMQILRALERRPRNIYCGAIGFIAPSGQMRFNVAIRTLTLHAGGEAVFNVGGGILFDSEVRSEYDECLLKARFASGPDPKSCLRADV
ncbi:aminodeoxychorismate synthase component I [Roseovarius sp. HI0049]|nr:aminodeoxychorismate synthase component I [Roseovarius sp. HI0049]